MGEQLGKQSWQKRKNLVKEVVESQESWTKNKDLHLEGIFFNSILWLLLRKQLRFLHAFLHFILYTWSITIKGTLHV